MARPLDKLIRWGQIVVVGLGAIGILLALLWLNGERRWGRWEPLSDRDAFVHGALGLEIVPLKYVIVMGEDDVSGSFFRRGEGYRSWIDDYGFLPNPDSTGATLCLETAATEAPVGVAVSHHLPASASPSPIPFVGFSCAACHSVKLDTTDGPGPVLYGPGSISLDLIAWGDALKNAVSDPNLTVKKIQDAYDELGCEEQGFVEKMLETAVLNLWLTGLRGVFLDGTKRFGLPYAGDELLDPHLVPPGPSRTRPFRSIVRVAMEMPGATNRALSKVPAAFEQNHLMRDRSQYDGSIGDYVVRSLIAAYTSGAQVPALANPAIEHNVRASARHTLYLGSVSEPADPQDGATRTPVPTFAESFPGVPIDPALAAAGLEVYMLYCNDCHGYRPLDGGEWRWDGARWFHQVSWLDPADGTPTIDTDGERIHFRYNDVLTLAMQTAFPGDVEQRKAQLDALKAAQERAVADGKGMEAALWKSFEKRLDTRRRMFPLGHPFYFGPEVLRDDKGYYNNPIPRAYLRSPYLHHGAVPNMRQLINLDPRPERFCRGRNLYDPGSMGIVAPAPDPAGRCPDETPFLYDGSLPGNSVRGHDFPWPYEEGRSPERTRQLEALLEYLRTV
ncbi:MAG: hypothetical protein R3325_00705 [Thermoanaerobaculia bacterium]|nr:hypothetical protein [Thermoanaerobaculia bacterium]